MHTSIALWLGTVAHVDELDSYLEGHKQDDGSYLPSAFEQTYQLKILDPDFLEYDCITSPSSSLSELLSGFSYEQEVVAAFATTALKQAYNAVILCFRCPYEYDDEINETSFTYIGTRRI